MQISMLIPIRYRCHNFKEKGICRLPVSAAVTSLVNVRATETRTKTCLQKLFRATIFKQPSFISQQMGLYLSISYFVRISLFSSIFFSFTGMEFLSSPYALFRHRFVKDPVLHEFSLSTETFLTNYTYATLFRLPTFYP